MFLAWIYCIVFIQSSFDVKLFPQLAFVNNKVNICVKLLCGQRLLSLGYIPRSGITGPGGNSLLCGFLGNCLRDISAERVGKACLKILAH